MRRVVCAANRIRLSGDIVLGVRHFDRHMCSHLDRIVRFACGDPVEQGFVDQFGVFMTREEAWEVATAANQIIRRCGSDEGCLYSENLY